MQNRMSQTHKLGVGLALAAALALAACKSPPRGLTYDEYVSRFIEDTENNLVSAWGIPDDSYSLETGGRLLEYVEQDTNEVLCTTRFTIDSYGLVKKYWYRGKKCLPPQQG